MFSRKTKIVLAVISLIMISLGGFFIFFPQTDSNTSGTEAAVEVPGRVKASEAAPESTPEQANLSEGEFTIHASSTGATLYIEGIPTGNFTAYFIKNEVIWSDLNFSLEPYVNNITWRATGLGYETLVWLNNESNGKIKFGAEYNGSELLPQDIIVVFNWTWLDGVKVEKNPDGKVVWLSHPDFMGHHNQSGATYEINYYDLPEGSEITETESRTSYKGTTYFKIDPHAGNSCDTANTATEDDFHDHCHQAVTDTLVTNDCEVNFLDFQALGGTLRGSFDSPREPGNTIRTPISLNVVGDLSIVATSALCRVIIRTDQSCAGTIIVDQTFALNPVDVNPQQNTFNITNTTFLGHFGELCVQLNATVFDAVGAGATAVTSGRIGIAPRADDINVSNATINFFQTQTLNHNFEADEAANITEVWARLINSSNNATLHDFIRDTTPASSITQQLVNFTTNPTANFNVTYNYTMWTDNARNHTRFSTTSLNSKNDAEPLGFSPRTAPFNLTNLVTCSNFNSFDGVSVYNKGVGFPEKNGIIRDWQGLAFIITDSIQFDLHYRTSGSTTNQFSNTSWDINSTGGWQRRTQIPAAAPSGFNFSGLPYDMFFVVDADGDANENMSCTYSNTFNVSSLLQHSNISGSINNGTLVNVSPVVYNRGETGNFTVFVFLANGTLHRSQSGFGLFYRNNATTTQIVSTGEATDANGQLNDDFLIGSANSSLFRLQGIPWFTIGCESNGNCWSFNGGSWNGTQNGTLNVSSLLQVSTSSSTVTNTTSVNVTPSRYNRGEIGNFSLFVWKARNVLHSSISTFNLFYKDNNTDIQIVSTGETTDSNGQLNDDFIIGDNNASEPTFLGRPWFVSGCDTSTNCWSFNDGVWNGTANTTFNVSSWYLLNHRDQDNDTLRRMYSNFTFPLPNDTDQLTFVIGFQTVYAWNEVRNARNESLDAISTEARRWNSNDQFLGADFITTGSDGYTTTFSQQDTINPVGAWTFGGVVEHNGNSGAQNHTIKFQDGADGDPLTLACSDFVKVNISNITCTLRLTQLNGTPISGQTVNINWTQPNGTSVFTTMTEINTGTGNYRARINASLVGTYDVLVNATVDSVNRWASYTILSNEISAGGGGGGLTAEQNQTLFNIEQILLNGSANVTATATVDFAPVHLALANNFSNLTGNLTNVNATLHTALASNFTNLTALEASFNASLYNLMSNINISLYNQWAGWTGETLRANITLNVTSDIIRHNTSMTDQHNQLNGSIGNQTSNTTAIANAVWDYLLRPNLSTREALNETFRWRFPLADSGLI